MRIFIHVRGSSLDKSYKDPNIRKSNSFKEMIGYSLKNGSVSMLGFPAVKLHKTFFIAIANGWQWQKRWADEHNISYSEDNWEKDILRKQIEYFKPDVLLSFTAVWVAQNPEIFKDIPLKCFWKASPVPEHADYSYFDVGLSYSEHYMEMLKAHGAPHTEKHPFSFDPDVVNKFEKEDNKHRYDISFCGSYSPMFSERNELLKHIAEHFGKKYKVAFFLKAKMRSNKWYSPFSKIPAVRKELLWYYRKPVFLEHYLKVLYNSNIVFNAHSNIAGNAKGNMRIFETLGMKSLLLSDAGEYPDKLKAGRDFVAYHDKNDLLEKIEYYITHQKEAQAVAEKGYETLAKHYSVEQGEKRILQIFKKYL